MLSLKIFLFPFFLPKWKYKTSFQIPWRIFNFSELLLQNVLFIPCKPVLPSLSMGHWPSWYLMYPLPITQKSRKVLVRRDKWRSPAQPPAQSTAPFKAWPHHSASCTVTLRTSPNTENPHPPTLLLVQYQNSAQNHRKTHLSLGSSSPFYFRCSKR